MNSLVVTSRSFSKHPILRREVLSRYPDAKFNDEGLSLKDDLLVNFLKGHKKAITALEKIDEFILSKLPELEVISKYGVGLDMIDLYAMDKFDLKLGWTAGVNKRSVAELVISFSIALLHRAIFANAEVRAGRWKQIQGRQLSECTVGIIGCGHIGKDVVRLLQPFNCKILVHDIVDYYDFYKQYNVVPVDLTQLLTLSDVVTLHLPLNESTKYILNRERIGILKPNAILINLARGGLIDEVALKERLLENRIGGVGLDVLDSEPLVDTDFAAMDNVLITPHIGGSTEEAILAMGMAAIEGLENARSPLEYL